ncbi:exodeoxyribonuclease VII large subunit [Rapidithrix thailandica]|uniref:Exodeoxyribonuclease 7 large subunit n=1 Tax=Rapidithrix thailandica TaxID=413964 RepID=A0AAW9SC51_9BACT
MKYFTLYQLNKSIQKHLQSIQREVWITAEVAQVNIAEHCYLELVQKDEQTERIVARSRGIIWSKRLDELYGNLGEDLENLLAPGVKVLVQVMLNFHQVHGLSLLISDIDPRYTLGELELKRQATLKKLQELDLLNRQKLLTLPPVLQRIAIISSPEAAGYTDFINQLQHNAYGYDFQLTLYQTAVQGERALPEIARQLQQVHEEAYDVVVLIRGGGSKLDLEVFNEFAIAEQIALLPYPVLTGIGHHRDETVADLVAYHALKTPTAVAEFLIQYNLEFEMRLQQLLDRIVRKADGVLEYQLEVYRQLENNIKNLTQNKLQQEHTFLQNQKMLLQTRVDFMLQKTRLQLEAMEKQIESLSPERVLARGFSITLKDGKVVKPGLEVLPGDVLSTHTSVQVIESKVLKIQQKNENIE